MELGDIESDSRRNRSGVQTMSYEKRLSKALDRAVEEGWLDEEDKDDWMAVFDCFSSHDDYNFNCDTCPLEDLCLEAKGEGQ